MEWICGIGIGVALVVGYMYWVGGRARPGLDPAAMRVLITTVLAQREIRRQITEEIARLICEGLTDQQVAARLGERWGDPTIDARLIGVGRRYPGGPVEMMRATHRQFRAALDALDNGDHARAQRILETVEQESNLRGEMAGYGREPPNWGE